MKVLIFNNEVLLSGIVSTQLICKLFIGTGAETAPILPVSTYILPCFPGMYRVDTERDREIR